jgi:hypothetical protein
MTTLKDFISPEVKNLGLGLFSLLAMWAAGSDLYAALKTGVAQRLSSTPRYTRSEQPVRFWLLVIFFAIAVIVFAGILTASIVHWHDEKVF